MDSQTKDKQEKYTFVKKKISQCYSATRWTEYSILATMSEGWTPFMKPSPLSE